jgi:hypothetical protein
MKKDEKTGVACSLYAEARNTYKILWLKKSKEETT